MTLTGEGTLTLVVPTRNSESRGTLTRLEGLSQSTQRFNGALHISIVDDASVDQSFALLSSFDSRYPFVRVCQTNRRLGPGGSRNLGLELADSPVVAFADDDDIVNLDRLLHAASRAQSSGADVTASPYRMTFHDPVGNRTTTRTISLGDAADIPAVLHPYPAVWRFLFSREFLAYNRLKFPLLSYAEDLLFLLEVARCSPTFVVGHEVYYEHLRQPRSLSGDLRRLGAQPVDVERRLRDFASATGKGSALRGCANQWASRIAARTLVQGSIRQRRDMTLSCLRDPGLIAHLVRYAASSRRGHDAEESAE